METERNQFLEDESEDALLARIQEESLRYFNEVELPRRAAEQKEKGKNKEGISYGDLEPQPHCSKNISDSEEVPSSTPVSEVFFRASGNGADGFHLAAGETYVYPTNYPIRQYQKTIIHSALFHNTLVSLPTGLGKTFIAAVVMYNFYRWFPQGKIVFMAPTRPLVAQQIRACHDIMAIPIKDTIEMTGAINPTERLQHWKSKRVFFLTPQVMANDLRTKACPPSCGAAFKCVVIDEAHRATKEYSYCHVIKELETAGAFFRVLALSATPGSNIKAVVEVVQNLRISTLELRGEDSPDVVPYTHAKQVEPVSLPLSRNISEFREQYLLTFERYARSLRESRLITCNVQNLTKFQLLKASEKIRSRPPSGMNKARVGALMSDFFVCMTLAHGLELIQTYGLRAFYQYFTACEDEENRKAAFTRLNVDEDFRSLMEKLQKAVSSPMDQFWSHPKHEHLVNILKDHFCQAEKQGTDTKVIIFCQYRVVVSELFELLQTTHPLIKPVMFIGQGVGKDKSGLPQKKQIEVMKGFRLGVSNVLIATCVAEEGLDIGSVDLLVMMECQRSPVRLVQRLGRTGRHRQGRCVVLLTAGKEVQKFNEAMATRKSFISMIQNSNILKSNLIKDEPQMIPPHIKPKMQLVHIKVPERVTPGKRKKQGDIRQALLTKMNDVEEKTHEESPFLDAEQLAQVGKELGSTEIKFDTLNFSKPTYLFHRMNDVPMQPDELFGSNFTQQSEYNDWNRVLHQTYLVLHSKDTEAMCHILQKSESMMLNTHADLNSQQINSSNLLPQKKNEKKKNKTKNDNVEKKKKKEKEERQGRDIRECLAQVAEKVRLTQKKFVEGDEKGRAEQINVDLNRLEPIEDENCQPFPDPIILDVSDTIITIEDPTKEVKNTNSIELKESDCLLCDKSFSLALSINSKRKTKIDNLVLNFKSLTKLEWSIHKFSKVAINNIQISKMFDEKSNIVNNINNSLQRLKDKVNFSNTKRITSPMISVDDIFDSDSLSPVLDCNIPNLKKEQNNESKHIPSNVKEEDFFNLEDLFNEDEDELCFQSIEKNTKTSTPLKANCNTANGTRSSTIILEKDSIIRQGEKDKNNLISVKDKLVPKLSEHISPITKINSNPTKPVFKIPQMKLNFVAMSSPKPVAASASKINISSPGSPILSGQTSAPQNTFSPVLSRQVIQNTDSFLSPVLSRQVSLSQNNTSPILSGQVSSSVKLERKILFKENTSEGDQYENSDWCKPLDSEIKHSNTDMAEIDALNLLSASQLFDDSSGEEKKELDQSSMYTISQMVAKVSALADKMKDTTQFDGKSNQNIKTTKAISNVHFESSDEDSIFEQINLDDFLVPKDSITPKTNFANRKNLDSFFKPPNHSSAIKNHVNDLSEIEKKEIEKINLLKQANINFSASRENDGAKLHEKELSQRDEESFISTRWLTCMKTPLKHLKPNKSVSFASETKDTSKDSDSDSDIFENKKSSKLKRNSVTEMVNQRKKIGKSKKKRVKGQFVEMEADVSMTGGVECSSDEENTSGLDEMDESFINDFSEMPSTSVDVTTNDIHAKYLQSVKSPNRIPGFKIPKLTESILARDVFSQVVPEDENDSYENDSFCCDATEIPVEDEPSELEIAEQLLKQKSKMRKKRKRKQFRPDSSSEEITEDLNEVLKKRRLLSSSSSTEDIVNCVQRLEKRKHLSSTDSSPVAIKYKKVQKKKRRRVQLLTSSDSDSDKTIL